ncbi:MAG: hypothetical protein EZS28_049008, partial [Streblomastix strix]
MASKREVFHIADNARKPRTLRRNSKVASRQRSEIIESLDKSQPDDGKYEQNHKIGETFDIGINNLENCTHTQNMFRAVKYRGRANLFLKHLHMKIKVSSYRKWKLKHFYIDKRGRLFSKRDGLYKIIFLHKNPRLTDYLRIWLPTFCSNSRTKKSLSGRELQLGLEREILISEETLTGKYKNYEE